MNKENGIKRLNRISVKSKEYRDENTQVVKLSQALEVVELLDEPEKPVVPPFVAKYIEVQREDGYENIGIAIKRIERRGGRSRLFNWFFFENNSDLFAKAWIYGYTAEEKKYYVLSTEKRAMLVRKMDGKTITQADPFPFEELYDVEKKSYALTEQEIKSYDHRYWAFAEEVQNERKRCENHISQIVHN